VHPRKSSSRPVRERRGASAPSGLIRIVIADDHAIFRAGLRRLLDAERDFEVIGEAATADDAVSLCSRDSPDVLLLDVGLSAGRGVEVIERLGPTAGLRILVLTLTMARDELVRTLQIGAHGVVLKETPPPLLLKSIRRVHAGEFWVGRDMVADLVRALNSTVPLPRVAINAPRTFALTPRELEIVAAVAAGYTNRQMSEKFGLAQDTIKHHLTSIFNKTGVSNRLELALFALHHRLA
jgi:two-component system nitrate/nitrite response regulator NarL